MTSTSMPANIHGRNPCIPDQVEDKLHTGKTIVRIAAVEKTISDIPGRDRQRLIRPP